MEIKDTDVQKISIAQLQPNEGQLEEIGIHANPRQITEDEYNALKASIQTDDLTGVFPLKVYPHEGAYVVLGGNMRLRALQEMGAKEVSCIVIPKNIPAQKLNKIIITDNSTFGDWDMDALANEWDIEELKDWGVDLPKYTPNLNPISDIERQITDSDLERACEQISEELKPTAGHTIEVTCPHCGEVFTIRV